MEILKGNIQILGTLLVQGHANFSSGCDFIMGLGKLKLCTKFEVASFSQSTSCGSSLALTAEALVCRNRYVLKGVGHFEAKCYVERLRLKPASILC